MVKRRTYGTGSVTELGDGKWLLRTSHRSKEDGSRIRINKVVEAKNRKAAETLLAGMTGARVTKGRLDTWTVDRWMKHVYGNPELAPRTWEVALQYWNLYSSDALKATPLGDLHVEDIDRELDRLRNTVTRYGHPIAPKLARCGMPISGRHPM
jgi:hypothetical protein